MSVAGDHAEIVRANTEIADLRRQLAEWETEVSKEMPPDFKDWWQNSKKEWPLVARLVLENRRIEEQYALQTVANLHKEVSELKTEIERLREERNQTLLAEYAKELGVSTISLEELVKSHRFLLKAYKRTKEEIKAEKQRAYEEAQFLHKNISKIKL